MFESLRYGDNEGGGSDNPEKMEKISPEKKRLLELEKAGKFVFHGSPYGRIKILEPRQPVIGVKSENHGGPRVAAAAQAEIAIFRAIVNESNFPGKGDASGFGVRGGGLYFEVSPSIFKNISDGKDDKEGYVYVVSKSAFKKVSAIEFGSSKGIEPIEVIRVTSKDLPEGIVMISDD